MMPKAPKHLKEHRARESLNVYWQSRTRAAMQGLASGPKLSPERLDAYLERIRYPASLGPPTPTLQTLKELQLRHVRTVPFENFSIVHPKLKGNGINTDLDSIYSKIVEKRQGGYCFEVRCVLSNFSRA